MKKIMMTLVAIAMATTMNAQWYVGGSVGFGSVKAGSGDSETTYKVIPEVGYSFNDKWSVGVALGYAKGSCSFGNSLQDYTQNVTTEVFSVNPYARYTFVNEGKFSIFCDGGIGFESWKDMGTNFSVGLRPGFAFKASDKISLEAHIGFVGFNTFSPKGGGDSSNSFGLDLTGVANSFGIYYNF